MSYTNDDTDFLKARLNDMLELSERNYMPVYSDFLDEKQISIMTSELSGMNNFMLFGGYKNAQRKMLCIYPDYFSPSFHDFPISIIEFSYRKSDILTHRDFLGSIMACRVKREKVGDILVSEGRTQVMVCKTVSNFLTEEIKKIGRTGVKILIAEKCTIERIQNFQDIIGTVASMRLDCILSLALRQSREKTLRIIKKDGIELNFTTVCSPSVTIKENDVFSVRGFGKFILKEISGTSSKGRLHVLIQKFI